MYETADAIRIEALKASSSPEVAGLAAKIEREEDYHLMHAEMWADRLRATEEGRRRFDAALAELWPHALGLLEPVHRAALADAVGLEPVEPVERGTHTDDWSALWEEMTVVRRMAPGAAW